MAGAWRLAAMGLQVMAKHCGHAAGRRLRLAGRDMAPWSLCPQQPFRLIARGGCLCSWEAAAMAGASRLAAKGLQVMAKHGGHAAGRRLRLAGRDMAPA